MGRTTTRDKKRKTPPKPTVSLPNDIANVGLTTNGKTPDHVSAAIIGFEAIGSGFITDFRLNNRRIKKRLTYKKSLKLKVGVGLVADDRVVQRIDVGDKWTIGTMKNSGVTFNYIDKGTAQKYWLEHNPGKSVEDMPLGEIIEVRMVSCLEK
jgi:hypothetical protein